MLYTIFIFISGMWFAQEYKNFPKIKTISERLLKFAAYELEEFQKNNKSLINQKD